jgi:ADP-ribosylglycohydrolase
MTALNRALGAFLWPGPRRRAGHADAIAGPRNHQDLASAQITDLQDAGPLQPIAANMPKGSITDDTEQAILVGELLVEGAGPDRAGECSRNV